MTESVQELEKRLTELVRDNFREDLLNRGLARGLIWQFGFSPDYAQSTGENLTDDLLDYGYTIMFLALRLRAINRHSKILCQAFQVAGKAIEAVVYRRVSFLHKKEFHCICAAVSYHLGGYAAQAYSILPSNNGNLSNIETALMLLLHRNLDELHKQIVSWLLEDQHHDSHVAGRLINESQFEVDDAVNIIFTNTFMRSMAYFEYAIVTGDEVLIEISKVQMGDVVNASLELNFVYHWWMSTFALHLLDELWQCSLHQRIPKIPPIKSDSVNWNKLRWLYIQRLRVKERAAIELWPSQFEAAKRSIGINDNLVIALPTGAGKTRVAELCALRALALGRRVVYVTPLRALSAQIEHDLQSIFCPLNYTVSTLYGSAGIATSDAKMVRECSIAVVTPEKLDFLLRVDPNIIGDVGLVIFDEGHMFEPDERGVRFEILVQQLLLRSDARQRRLIFLSAIFPNPSEMRDLIGWIRQDEPGGPVYSEWCPTRQRYGEIIWGDKDAQLETKFGSKTLRVRRFIKETNRTNKSTKKETFPSDKQELTLAAAWKFAKKDESVLIYCPRRDSVSVFGRKVLACLEDGVLDQFDVDKESIQSAVEIGEEWLGSEHEAIQCLKHGVALHHAGLPKAYLNELNMLLRDSNWPVIISSPTLAKGLNLSISVILLWSLFRDRSPIPHSELKNVAGRAGRAFVCTEGKVLFVNMEKVNRGKTNWYSRKWWNLVDETNRSPVESGFLKLVRRVVSRISKKSGIDERRVIEYLLEHEDAWIIEIGEKKEEIKEYIKWEADIASLDAAILGLLDIEQDTKDINESLDVALAGSLFKRTLDKEYKTLQQFMQAFLECRAMRIWNATNARKRSGYKSTGIGLHAGQHFDNNLQVLSDLLLEIEDSVKMGDGDRAVSAVVEISNIVLEVSPFLSADVKKEERASAIRAWMEGVNASEVIKLGGKYGVDLLQNTLTYRLPWALEAARVQVKVMGLDEKNKLTGLSALSVAAGSTDRSVITLMSAGMNSRESAKFVVMVTDAKFVDREGMLEWLNEESTIALLVKENWPENLSYRSWMKFWSDQNDQIRKPWLNTVEPADVEWFTDPRPSGQPVTISQINENGINYVLTVDMKLLGKLVQPLQQGLHVINAWIDKYNGKLYIECFGRKS